MGDIPSHEKSIFPELGVELVVDILLFIFPYGAEQMNLAHIFWLGFSCWVIGIVIAVRMFWIFPLWSHRLTRLEKGLLAGILIALFVVMVHKPIIVAYGKRNGNGTTGQAPFPTGPVTHPAPAPAIPQPATPAQNPTKAHTPKSQITAPATTPQTVINAPGGIGISGGQVTNPTVNNFAPPQRTISKEQLDDLRLVIGGSTGSVSSNCPMSDDEGCNFAESIRKAFENVGWNAGPHVGLTSPTGKKQPFVYVGLVDPFHPSINENLVISGLRSMNISVIAGHSNDARGDDVPIFIDASVVPIKPQP
jgi:hypothetical protein